MEDLVKAVNAALLATGDVNDNIKLTYSALTVKVTVQINNSFQFALFKPLSILIGFGGTEPIIKKTTESPYAADLTVVSTIYVYCDVVEPQIVGDTSAQLLKSIPPPKESLATLLLKRLPTFNTYRSEQNSSKLWKCF